MSQINPQRIIDEGIVKMSEHSKVQQVGIDLSLSSSIKLQKGECMNVLLNEKIKLPADMYATFQQRSSYSRKGVFVTTGVYDPGYEGSLGCTIYNFGPEIFIGENERIGQLLVFKADPASTYSGQWQGK